VSPRTKVAPHRGNFCDRWVKFKSIQSLTRNPRCARNSVRDHQVTLQLKQSERAEA
jgi:hypothetical protein